MAPWQPLTAFSGWCKDEKDFQQDIYKVYIINPWIHHNGHDWGYVLNKLILLFVTWNPFWYQQFLCINNDQYINTTWIPLPAKSFGNMVTLSLGFPVSNRSKKMLIEMLFKQCIMRWPMKIKEMKILKSNDLFRVHFWMITGESFFQIVKTTKTLQTNILFQKCKKIGQKTEKAGPLNLKLCVRTIHILF